MKTKITLRSFLCCVLVPSYVDCISTTPCGWILARTLLHALPSIFKSLLLHVDSFDPSSMQAMQSIILSVLARCCTSATAVFKAWTFDIKASAVLTQYLAIAEAALEPSDYLYRQSSEQYETLSEIMLYLAQVASFFIVLPTHAGAVPHTLRAWYQRQAPYQDLPAPLQAAQEFVQDSLQRSLTPGTSQCKWMFENGRVLVHRNLRWEPVNHDVGCLDAHQQALCAAAKSFLSRLESMPSFGWIVQELGVEHVD